MSPYVRTVKTTSGATAVQIVHSSRRGSRDIQHAHSGVSEHALETAFGCALSLRRDANLEFVIAPVPTLSGTVVRRLSERYSLAACPYLTGCEPSHEGAFPAADRPAVVRLLTELHRATPAVAPQRCDFGLQYADGLRAAMASTGEPWHTGRYGEQARALLARTQPG